MLLVMTILKHKSNHFGFAICWHIRQLNSNLMIPRTVFGSSTPAVSFLGHPGEELFKSTLILFTAWEGHATVLLQ